MFALPGTTFGPELDVHADFPTAGIYQLWAQFRLADGDRHHRPVHRPGPLRERAPVKTPEHTSQRVIGLLGGMSWESTAEYYRLANERVRDRLGGLHSARIVLASVDFAEIEALQVAGDGTGPATCWPEAARWRPPARSAAALHQHHAQGGRPGAGGGDHPAAAPGRHHRCRGTRRGLTTVGLLATGFTMEQDFYRDRLAGHGLERPRPDADDRAEVHRIIYDELCRGLSGESRGRPTGGHRPLVAAGAQGIILGCTEIELLIGPADSPVPVFPTTRLHVEAGVTAALQPHPLAPQP